MSVDDSFGSFCRFNGLVGLIKPVLPPTKLFSQISTISMTRYSSVTIRF